MKNKKVSHDTKIQSNMMYFDVIFMLHRHFFMFCSGVDVSESARAGAA